ncbi:unnamed protein product [Lymnaea stagnalis]|uniref:TIR domain-containing protein n=1 Tax=Lymnaea stagnalis TaxID=6523 RepID=A0AAV2HSG1_LYMST
MNGMELIFIFALTSLRIISSLSVVRDDNVEFYDSRQDNCDLELYQGKSQLECAPLTGDLYHNLWHGTMAKNKTTQMTSCCRLCCYGQVADCGRCNLTEVPQDLPDNITHLLLNYNNITSSALYPGVFVNYSKLLVLQMDSNNLTVLPEGVFYGLSSLIQLSLYNNNILMDSALNGSTVFALLGNTLKILVMNRNNPNTSSEQLMYPDFALSFLTKLTVLHIDGLMNKTFDHGFSNLKNLRNLTLAGFKCGYCNIHLLSNETFQFLTSLHHLNVSDCGIQGKIIENGAFEKLTELRSLDVSHNFDLGLSALGNVMYSFRNSPNLRHLKLQRIGARFAACIVVYKHTLRHFKNTSLEVIEAMDNEIEMIEFGAIQMLPPTLRTLNLTNNRIMFGAYWRDMGYLTRLQSLHLDNVPTRFKFALSFPSKKLHCKPPPNEDGSDVKEESDEPFILPLPPTLTQLTMHSNSLEYQVNNISFSDNNSLEHVDISGNMFNSLIGPITGLHSLKNLSMSSCFIETIKNMFFKTLTSLRYLNLFQNLLGECLYRNNDIFDPLINLTYLNISFNNLYRLSNGTFKSLRSLEILDLSTNRLGNIHFSIAHMQNLKLLDLHKNQIGSLHKHIRTAINELLAANKTLYVDMRNNPILCDCDNLEFLEWVVETNIFRFPSKDYYCKYVSADQVSVEMPDGYEDEVRKLRRLCKTNVGLFVAVVGATLAVLVSLLGVIMYRLRWTLRYWYHAAKFYVHHKASPEMYEYDVFISYENGDVKFVLEELCPKLRDERKIKVLIHGENFQVGRQIADNIYMAVTQCRKTLVILTRRLLASKWCKYELQMARLESINTGFNVLIFLLMDEIPTHEINVEVMSYIKSSMYIAYPKDPNHRKAFWDKLAHDIKA